MSGAHGRDCKARNGSAGAVSVGLGLQGCRELRPHCSAQPGCAPLARTPGALWPSLCCAKERGRRAGGTEVGGALGGQQVLGLSRERALLASERRASQGRPHPSLDPPFGGPDPPGTMIPAKKTVFFSLWTPKPHRSQAWPPGTDSRPNYLPPASFGSFQGEGPFATFGAAPLGGAWQPAGRASLDGRVASGRTPSDPHVPGSVSGSGMLE